jgi:hypothetical protein
MAKHRQIAFADRIRDAKPYVALKPLIATRVELFKSLAE